MNRWQLLKEIKAKLEGLTWPGGNPVLGSVVVTGERDQFPVQEFRLPLAIVRLQEAPGDQNNAGAVEQRVQVALAAANEADNVGERTLLGANWMDAGADSRGMGLLEIEEPILDMLQLQQRDGGVGLSWVYATGTEVAPVEELGMVAAAAHEFLARIQLYRTYPNGWNLEATDLGGGSVRLDWNNPYDRFDFLTTVIRRNAGSTAPTGPTDGTDVPLGAAGDETVTDSPGAGTYSYAAFWAYDEYGTGTANEHSSGLTREGVTVS